MYEDEEIIIVNKPSGLIVHPGAGNKENTLVNGLLHLYKIIYQLLMVLLDPALFIELTKKLVDY
jgi:23S rRNA-/tRNA-specific pseudouridylate synthase